MARISTVLGAALPPLALAALALLSPAPASAARVETVARAGDEMGIVLPWSGLERVGGGEIALLNSGNRPDSGKTGREAVFAKRSGKDLVAALYEQHSHDRSTGGWMVSIFSTGVSNYSGSVGDLIYLTDAARWCDEAQRNFYTRIDHLSSTGIGCVTVTVANFDVSAPAGLKTWAAENEVELKGPYAEVSVVVADRNNYLYLSAFLDVLRLRSEVAEGGGDPALAGFAGWHKDWLAQDPRRLDMMNQVKAFGDAWYLLVAKGFRNGVKSEDLAALPDLTGDEPPPAALAEPVATGEGRRARRLQELRSLQEQKLISPEEYEAKRKAIIEDL